MRPDPWLVPVLVELSVSEPHAKEAAHYLREELFKASKQRAGVLKSGLHAFQLMVARGLLSEELLLTACGLTATGNWDEMKMDLNKLLTAGALGLAGIISLRALKIHSVDDVEESLERPSIHGAKC